MLHRQRGQVYANKWGPGSTVDYPAAYHIWPVEACGFNTPTVRQFPLHQNYAALGFSGTRWVRLQARHVVTQVAVRVCLRLDLCLRQEHQVKLSVFHRPDGLRQSKASDIPYV